MRAMVRAMVIVMVIVMVKVRRKIPSYFWSQSWFGLGLGPTRRVPPSSLRTFKSDWPVTICAHLIGSRARYSNIALDQSQFSDDARDISVRTQSHLHHHARDISVRTQSHLIKKGAGVATGVGDHLHGLCQGVVLALRVRRDYGWGHLSE